jgi:hypothetical protein
LNVTECSMCDYLVARPASDLLTFRGMKEP